MIRFIFKFKSLTAGDPLSSQMTSVSEASLADAWAGIAEGEVVVWLSPAELLWRSCDAVLLLVGVSTSLLDLVELLIFAVFLEVILVIVLLEHFVEAECILLSLGLSCSLLGNDIVMLEVVEVWVLALEEMKFLFDCLSGSNFCVAVFFLNNE